jgi:prepilin-type N-terminal cleavage/methylation domain-containing protein
MTNAPWPANLSNQNPGGTCSAKSGLGGTRAGFTLIELMVTLIILSILGSLMLAGMVIAQTSARAAKTSSTIRKISELVLPYYERFETRRPRVNPTGLTRLEAQQLRRIAIRRLMTMELPERTRDIDDAFRYSAATDEFIPRNFFTPFPGKVLSEVPPVARRYRAIIQPVLQAKPLNLDPDDPESFNDPVSSADLLHMIVMRGPVADPDIIMHFRSDEMADTNGNGLSEFVDGWGEPIFFKRWPVGFNSPAQPIDGLRSSIDEAVSLAGHRLVPLIFSGGVDREPDIESAKAASYYACNYDPFAFLAPGYDASAARLIVTDPKPIPGAVVLAPAPVAQGEPPRIVAARWPSQGGLPAPWYVTTGCEADTNGNDRLESYDNIHNHDLTR